MKHNNFFKLVFICLILFSISSCQKDELMTIKPEISNKNARTGYCASCLKYTWLPISGNNLPFKVYSEFGVPDIIVQVGITPSIFANYTTHYSGSYPLNQYFNIYFPSQVGNFFNMNLHYVRLKINYSGNIEYTPWMHF